MFIDNLLKIAEEQFGVEKCSLEDNIITDLAGDSLDKIEFIMAVEEEFSIEIDDECAERINTLQDCLNVIYEIINNYMSKCGRDSLAPTPNLIPLRNKLNKYTYKGL